MTRWASITIVDGHQKLHTFDYVPCADDQTRLDWHHRAVTRHGRRNANTLEQLYRPGMTVTEASRAAWRDVRRPLPETFNHVPLGRIEARLALATGCSPTGRVLAFILDAVRDGGAQRVQVGDLAAAVTTVAPRIAALDSLDPCTRRRAEGALSDVIRQRCITV